MRITIKKWKIIIHIKGAMRELFSTEESSAEMIRHVADYIDSEIPNDEVIAISVTSSISEEKDENKDD